MRLEVRVALAAAVALVGIAGCERAEREPPAQASRPPAELERAGAYAMSDAALYRAVAGSLVALATLPKAGVTAADTLEECVAEIPELGKTRFQRLSLAPDTAWVAWATSGPGACVGVLGPGEPAVRVLGRWPGVLPDTLLWAPAGRYLAVGLARAAGRHSLEVFDALAAARLEMPWEVECGYVEDCDVAQAAWLGGTLLNVEIRLGPAERPVPFEVNVAATAPDVSEEENRG